MIPPVMIQTASSVDGPVRNLETSKLKEFVALIPITSFVGLNLSDITSCTRRAHIAPGVER